VGALEPVQPGHVDGELDKPSLQGFQGKIAQLSFPQTPAMILY